ncbi:MAG TPA: hypothetical protein VEA69_06320 [Tepidisphaeraceae bacterium]|nr:hypothetical protein [Tepidisphaeraceae bacterium]
MAIVAECPKCGKRFKAAESQVGRKAKCSACAHVFAIAVPAELATAAVAASPAVTVAVARPVGNLPPAQTTPTRVHAASTSPAKPARPVATQAVVRRATQSAPLDAIDALIAPDTEPAPRRTHTPRSQTSATTVADLPERTARPHKPEGRSRWRLMVSLGLVAIAGAAGAYLGPRYLKFGGAGDAAAPGGPPAEARTAAAVIGPLVPPASAPAWSADPDLPASPLALAPDFRLQIAPEPGMRFAPAAIQFAAAPSPYAAIPSLPGGDASAAETIAVWNMVTRQRTAQFRLAQPLAFAALSRDGAYYAGQAWESAARANRIEIWSTGRGQLAHAITVPSAVAFATDAVVGFPAEDQVAVLATDRLQVWDLRARNLVREVQLPARTEDTRAAASATFRLVAVADSRSLYLVDLPAGKVLGPAPIPESLVAHPRRRLSLRALEFSPDGRELALAFDNRVSARRIAVFDLATGRLKEIHAPGAPISGGGPELTWLTPPSPAAAPADAAPAGDGFLVSGGILLDRATTAQAGQIFGDLPDEGLGGALTTLVDGGRALVAWDKHPRGLVLRAVPVRREKSEWVDVQIAAAEPALFDQLQCAGRPFGNAYPTTPLSQAGRLPAGMRFLAVEATFTATLAAAAPSPFTLRPDQFALIADGEPRPPLGMLGSDGAFSIERPEVEVRRSPATDGATPSVRRTVVFAVSGSERSLALRVGGAVRPLSLPTAIRPTPQASYAVPTAERLPPSVFSAPDDAALLSVGALSARLGPHEADPTGPAAEQLPVPLRVSYASPPEAWLLTVSFDLTVNAPRVATGRPTAPRAPKLGLLLSDGTQLLPAAQFPGPLPVMLTPGERRTQTCLFVLLNDPARSRIFRLTCDDVPIATVRPDAPTARVAP